jgi:hypothetical protein
MSQPTIERRPQMNYSKIVFGLATGLLAAGLAAAAAPAWCVHAGANACSDARDPGFAYVVYPEASHVVYPDGVLKFGN